VPGRKCEQLLTSDPPRLRDHPAERELDPCASWSIDVCILSHLHLGPAQQPRIRQADVDANLVLQSWPGAINLPNGDWDVGHALIMAWMHGSLQPRQGKEPTGGTFGCVSTSNACNQTKDSVPHSLLM